MCPRARRSATSEPSINLPLSLSPELFSICHLSIVLALLTTGQSVVTTTLVIPSIARAVILLTILSLVKRAKPQRRRWMRGVQRPQIPQRLGRVRRVPGLRMLGCRIQELRHSFKQASMRNATKSREVSLDSRVTCIGSLQALTVLDPMNTDPDIGSHNQLETMAGARPIIRHDTHWMH